MFGTPVYNRKESLDKAIGVQRFLKRNIFPFCLSRHLQYDSIAAFFDFENEKTFSFLVGDFGKQRFLAAGCPTEVYWRMLSGGQQSR